MKRREIIRYTAYITGAAISAPLAASLLSGCKPNEMAETARETVSFFSSDELNLIKKLTDTIIPKTDSPSASDVGIPDMINHMVGNVYNEADQKEYRTRFNLMSKYVEGKSDLLAGLKSLESSSSSEMQETKDAYLKMKQQTVAYYLSSEEIGTKYLNYLPVPGAYEACISVDDVDGKAWAI